MVTKTKNIIKKEVSEKKHIKEAHIKEAEDQLNRVRMGAFLNRY